MRQFVEVQSLLDSNVYVFNTLFFIVTINYNN